MTDIVTRLRNWREVHLARLHLLMDEAADEMERLSASVDCPAPDNGARQDILTDDEREAIESAIWDYEQNDDDEDCARMVCTLEGLLERMA
jgi:hypothetical protein